jgi:hypothetical protein
VQLLNGGDVEVQEPGERQVDVLDLLRGDLLVDAAQGVQLDGGQRHGGVGAQRPPGVTIQPHVGRVRDGSLRR